RWTFATRKTDSGFWSSTVSVAPATTLRTCNQSYRGPVSWPRFPGRSATDRMPGKRQGSSRVEHGEKAYDPRPGRDRHRAHGGRRYLPRLIGSSASTGRRAPVSGGRLSLLLTLGEDGIEDGLRGRVDIDAQVEDAGEHDAINQA